MRYAHQPLSEIDAMTVRRRRRLVKLIVEKIKQENGNG
jgi:hypothetical protein